MSISCARSHLLHKKTGFLVQNLCLSGVVLPLDVVYNACAVNPGIFIFTKEAIAAFEETLNKSIATDGMHHIMRARGTIVTARTICWRKHILMKADDDFRDFS